MLTVLIGGLLRRWQNRETLGFDFPINSANMDAESHCEWDNLYAIIIARRGRGPLLCKYVDLPCAADRISDNATTQFIAWVTI
jgi:hypothetical protein